MRGEVHILVYCPIDTLQWGQTHSALIGLESDENEAIDELRQNVVVSGVTDPDWWDQS